MCKNSLIRIALGSTPETEQRPGVHKLTKVKIKTGYKLRVGLMIYYINIIKITWIASKPSGFTFYDTLHLCCPALVQCKCAIAMIAESYLLLCLVMFVQTDCRT